MPREGGREGAERVKSKRERLLCFSSEEQEATRVT